MARGSLSGEGDFTRTKTVVNVRVDYTALLRDFSVPGEVCEIDGIGPVPVTTAKAWLEDSFVKLVVREAESDAVRDFLMAQPSPLTSRIATVEVRRAIGRATEAPHEEALAAVWDRIEIIELDAAIADSAALIAPRTIRSLDAIHLVSALALADELDAFVTYDVRLGEAAAGSGLTVVSPGT